MKMNSLLAIIFLIGSQAFAETITYIVHPMYNQECVDDVKATICVDPSLKDKILGCTASIQDSAKGNGQIEFTTRGSAKTEDRNSFRQVIEATTRKVISEK